MRKAQASKKKIGKLDFIKFENFRASKDTIKKMKGRPTEWEKMFTNPMLTE